MRARVRAGLALFFASALSVGCASASSTPLLHVPLMTRAGQVEAGMTVHPTEQRMQLGGTVRGAVTDHLRAGASVSTGYRRGGYLAEVDRRSLLADGFLGLEGRGLFLRYGALLGAGYGHAPGVRHRCISEARMLRCAGAVYVEDDYRYVRAYGQMHVGIAAPGPLAVSFAVRIPLVIGLEDGPIPAEVRASPELALTHTLTFRFFRLDLQPLWSHAQGLSFQLAVLGRFSP